MAKQRFKGSFKVAVILVLITYLFCVLSTLMLLSKRLNAATGTGADSEKHILKSNGKTAGNFIGMMDRTVISQMQGMYKPAWLSLFLVFGGLMLSGTGRTSTPIYIYTIRNKQYSYLCFRSIRI